MRELLLTSPNMKGEDVRRWQKFLISRRIDLGSYGPDKDGADGSFGGMCDVGTRLWQERAEVPKSEHGRVGPLTVAEARKYKFDPDSPTGLVPGAFPLPPLAKTPDFVSVGKPSSSPSWPAKTFNALDAVDRERIFTNFRFTPAPGSKSAGGEISILDGWEAKNISEFYVSQLAGVPYYDEGNKLKCNGKIRFHKKAGKQLQDMFKAWEDAKLLSRILTFDGAYYPRYVRGSKVNLSNHSWGTAFDINANWNGLSKTPALYGQKGCVRELVEIAHKFGFFWGGHFSGGRGDGMHFEVAFLK